MTATASATPRRQVILSAAARLFADRGFHGVGMDDLGEAAGITGPGLYRHFRGKDAILVTLLTDVSEQLLAGGQQRAATAQDADGVLTELVRWQVDFALDNPELIVIQERDLDALPGPQRRTVRRLQRSYVEIWVDALRRRSPRLDEDSARTAVQATIGLINSTPHSVRTLAREPGAALLERMALAALRAA